jgi:murein L,D-transpeptidase YcbB/YkuD
LLSANVLSAIDNTKNVESQSATNIVSVVNNAPVSSCGEFTMTLKRGMDNPEVKCLQKLLNEKGYKIEGIPAGMETTFFGHATQDALKAFQSAIGNLTVDGVFGITTREALKK